MARTRVRCWCRRCGRRGACRSPDSCRPASTRRCRSRDRAGASSSPRISSQLDDKQRVTTDVDGLLLTGDGAATSPVVAWLPETDRSSYALTARRCVCSVLERVVRLRDPTLALSLRGADDEDPDDRLVAIPIAGFGVPLSRGALSSSRSPAALGLRGRDCWTRAATTAVDRYEVGTEQGSWRLFGTFSGWDLVAFTR